MTPRLILTLLRQGGCVSVAAAVVLLCTSPATAQPHAEDPLAPLDFSVDAASPLNIAMPGAAASILRKPGPVIVYPGPGLGLNSPLDDLDAYCYPRLGQGSPELLYLLVFGVDRFSVGAAPPDPALAATGRIFNVLDQADRNQVAGDIFMCLDAYTQWGRPFTTAADPVPGTPVPAHDPGGDLWSPEQGGPRNLDAEAETPKSWGAVDHGEALPRLAPIGCRGPMMNNTLASNQGDTGGVDQDLSPNKAPVQREPAPAGDDLDAADFNPSAAAAQVRGGSGLFFTVSRGSPSLPTLPGPSPLQSGADVFHDPVPEFGGTEELYLSAVQMGLVGTAAGDDIDALVVFDQDGVFGPGDQVLFSLARGSPSLTGQRSAADIFVYRYGDPSFSLFASALDLGLDPLTDNVDSLTMLPTENPSQSIHDKAIFLVWPGDFDHSGSLDATDCAAFPPCHSGAGVPYDGNGVSLHVVSVGPGPYFNPPVLNIEVGDRVRWVWSGDGLMHNVVSGQNGVFDGVFNSGPPTSIGGTVFEVTFDAALLETYPRHLNRYHYFSGPDFAAGMIGEIVVQPHPCACFDLDFDLDVDCNDWRDYRPVYREAAGQPCVPLTIEEFVSALLGSPLQPVHACIADWNADGLLNGLDVAGFVQTLWP